MVLLYILENKNQKTNRSTKQKTNPGQKKIRLPQVLQRVRGIEFDVDLGPRARQLDRQLEPWLRRVDVDPRWISHGIFPSLWTHKTCKSGVTDVDSQAYVSGVMFQSMNAAAQKR